MREKLLGNRKRGIERKRFSGERKNCLEREGDNGKGRKRNCVERRGRKMSHVKRERDREDEGRREEREGKEQ